MKSLFAVLLTACLCMSVKGEDSKPPRTLPGGWVYVWGDEFNGSRIDAKKWKPELGVIRNQGSQQTYTGRPKNMRLEDGCLVLETHFEKFANINYKKSSADWIKNTKFMPYTSGSVTTIKTKNFMFGRLEVRAKVPKTKGICQPSGCLARINGAGPPMERLICWRIFPNSRMWFIPLSI